MKPNLLWVGDAACPSGFARATHEILNVAQEKFNVTVLGINYRGDPHTYPYPIYAAVAGGDMFGISRLIEMCDIKKPDVIGIQQDGWNIPYYVKQLSRVKEYKDIPIVASLAVDGKNFNGEWLNSVRHAIFWTQFALNEARSGGYNGPAEVIPLGVDLDVYRPLNQLEVRRRKLPKELEYMFIVGNVNRNQPRKRWDLTLKYFAEWIHSEKISDAWLYLHTAPTGDVGVDVHQLAAYYGIVHRLALRQPPTWYGASEEDMCETYNLFDVQISTTQGEGFGLTTFEGMACGVPQEVPGWSALGELCKDAAEVIPCTSTCVGSPYVNVVGGVPDEEIFIKTLHALYNDEKRRMELREKGLQRVSEPRFRWRSVGERFTNAIAKSLPAVEAAIA